MNPFERTFHPDEANQAFTVGHLLETGMYTYRPTDHHGPTLYYAAAPLQRLTGHTNTAALDPILLRVTPLIFAILALVVAALAVFRIVREPPRLRALNEVLPPPTWLLPLAAVLLLGTAPLFVFFATDFIQEMLLTSFLLMMYWAATGFLGALSPGGTVPAHSPAPSSHHALLPFKPGTWALLFGAFAGLAYATKETCVISFGAAGLAALPFLPKLYRTFRAQGWPRRLGSHLVLGLLAFGIVSAILYSSFGQYWQGVTDAFITAPLSYLHRAAGDAASEGAAWHVHPWWQYFAWLFHYAPFEETLLFSFPLILVPCLLFLSKFFKARPNPTVLYDRPQGPVPLSHRGTGPQRMGTDPMRMGTDPFARPGTAPLRMGTDPLRPGTDPFARPGTVPHPSAGTVPLQPTALGVYLFALIYSIALMTVYALIPYKTPWCALQFLPGLVLATVFGIKVLQQRLPLPRLAHTLGLLAIVAAIVAFRLPALHIVWNEPDSSKIPFNYANSSPEVQELAHDVATALKAKRVQITPIVPAIPRGQTPAAGGQTPATGGQTPATGGQTPATGGQTPAAGGQTPATGGQTPATGGQTPEVGGQTLAPFERTFVAVALPATDTWPFPFYNRANEDRTGYWTSYEELLKLRKAGARPVAIIVPLAEGHLAQAEFPELTHTKRYYIRPGVRVRLFW